MITCLTEKVREEYDLQVRLESGAHGISLLMRSLCFWALLPGTRQALPFWQQDDYLQLHTHTLPASQFLGQESVSSPGVLASILGLRFIGQARIPSPFWRWAACQSPRTHALSFSEKWCPSNIKVGSVYDEKANPTASRSIILDFLI